MNTNPGLDKKARRNMYKMYEIGISVAEIANKFSMSYSLTHYYLRKKGLICTVKRYRRKESDNQFNYKEYLDALLERCRHDKGMKKREFRRFTKTEEGENFITRASVYYTPSIHLTIKIEKEIV
jgi:transposase